MTHLLLAVIYLSFVSLGLPDSLLGAAWPSMYGAFGVPVSYAGALSAIISVGTIFSSLQSQRLTRRLGAGRVTALSVALTALALFGFSRSGAFWQLCLWAVPYGLGAGSVDAALNNYVALHFASRHMSWLHCMWGLGASLGPYIMGFALGRGMGWGGGYGVIALLQAGLTAVVLLSLPLWKREEARSGESGGPTLTVREVFAIPGAREGIAAFFCYCALEQTTGLWAASYFTLHSGLSTDTAAGRAGVFYMGITLGRALGGFLTLRLRDRQMVRLGMGVIAAGVGVLFLPLGEWGAPLGVALVGLGCAPIYPSLIHATPKRFGVERSQAVIGVEMACAYVGNCLMPPLFGLVAQYVDVSLLPLYLLAILAVMGGTHEVMLVKTAGNGGK